MGSLNSLPRSTRTFLKSSELLRPRSAPGREIGSNRPKSVRIYQALYNSLADLPESCPIHRVLPGTLQGVATATAGGYSGPCKGLNAPSTRDQSVTRRGLTGNAAPPPSQEVRPSHSASANFQAQSPGTTPKELGDGSQRPGMQTPRLGVRGGWQRTSPSRAPRGRHRPPKGSSARRPHLLGGGSQTRKGNATNNGNQADASNTSDEGNGAAATRTATPETRPTPSAAAGLDSRQRSRARGAVNIAAPFQPFRSSRSGFATGTPRMAVAAGTASSERERGTSHG